MEALLIIIVLLWGSRIVSNILTYTQLWWVKRIPLGQDDHSPSYAARQTYILAGTQAPADNSKVDAYSSLPFDIFGLIMFINSWPILLRLTVADLMSFPMSWIFVGIVNAPVRLYHRHPNCQGSR